MASVGVLACPHALSGQVLGICSEIIIFLGLGLVAQLSASEATCALPAFDHLSCGMCEGHVGLPACLGEIMKCVHALFSCLFLRNAERLHFSDFFLCVRSTVEPLEKISVANWVLV